MAVPAVHGSPARRLRGGDEGSAAQSLGAAAIRTGACGGAHGAVPQVVASGAANGAPKIVRFYLRAFAALPMPKAPASNAPPAEPASYEAALEELEQLVGRIESGQLPLDQMLAGYQRGAALLAFCRHRLDAVQDQIKVLDEGSLQPWTQE